MLESVGCVVVVAAKHLVDNTALETVINDFDLVRATVEKRGPRCASADTESTW